ncbi:SDR family oxidoreductase [Caulobacter sp. KR2-114]|uniref:SDR family oxidoreductase n=1 Tax=Caulobacter sp. KR2-114 TaxID=3400912 RepID=UPI003BFEF717
MPDRAGTRGWALVTGAGRRIGRTLAIQAARAGYDVVVHVRADPEAGQDTAAEIVRLGRRSHIAAADLSDAEALPGLIGAADEPVTLLVNCASLFQDDRPQSLTAASFDAHIAANLRAPVLLAQAFAAALPADRHGQIVNIIDQRVWRLTPQFFSYTLSKSALWTATRTLAQALAPRIRVNAIGPGPTLASIHQSDDTFADEASAVLLGRGPHPDEIAAALAYLIDATSVTGQMIAVDGGQHLAWRTPDVQGD